MDNSYQNRSRTHIKDHPLRKLIQDVEIEIADRRNEIHSGKTKVHSRKCEKLVEFGIISYRYRSVMRLSSAAHTQY